MKETGSTRQQQSGDVHPLIRFLTRFRTPMIVIGVAVVVMVVGLLIALSIQGTREERALIAVEGLEDDLVSWVGLGSEEQTAQFELLEETATSIIEQYGSSYAGVRAGLLLAQALAELERWGEASVQYEEAAVRAGESYLAGVALMDAATTAENDGNPERALGFYRQVVDRFGDSSPEAPRAAFAVARILEVTDQITAAADAYRAVIEDYPTSSWTNLARNRIISLTVEGRIGG